jgi:hypothetical protein
VDQEEWLRPSSTSICDTDSVNRHPAAKSIPITNGAIRGWYQSSILSVGTPSASKAVWENYDTTTAGWRKESQWLNNITMHSSLLFV